jgi:hypothetical protein
MSTLTLRWKENRVREEIYKQHLKEIKTSAHAAGWPAPNGAIVTFHEQAAPAQAVQHTRNKNNKNLICWIYKSAHRLHGLSRYSNRHRRQNRRDPKQQ